MSRFLSPYATTACEGQSGFISGKVDLALKEAFITGATQPNEISDLGHIEQFACQLVTNPKGSNAVPPFNHPLTLDFEGKPKTFVNVTTAIRPNPQGVGYTVYDRREFEFIALRGQLQVLWTTDLPTLLRDCSKLPLAAFAFYIGDVVSRRLALDPRDQNTVIVLAAAFYLNLFTDEELTGKTDVFNMSGVIARATGIKQALVIDVLDPPDMEKGRNLHQMADLADFCTACQDATKSVRLRDLNPITLFGFVGGGWYGNNARELMAVALEHPPTWLALIYRALTDNGMFKSGLGEFLKRGMFRSLSTNFPAIIDTLSHKPAKVS